MRIRVSQAEQTRRARGRDPGLWGVGLGLFSVASVSKKKHATKFRGNSPVILKVLFISYSHRTAVCYRLTLARRRDIRRGSGFRDIGK